MARRRNTYGDETASTTTLVNYIVARAGGPNGGSSDTWQTIAARATQESNRNVTARDLINANVAPGASPEEINAWLAASGGAISNDGVNYTFAAGQQIKLPDGVMVSESAPADLTPVDTNALVQSNGPSLSTTLTVVLGGLGLFALAWLFSGSGSGSGGTRRRRRSYAGMSKGKTNTKKDLLLFGGAAVGAYVFFTGKAGEIVGDIQNAVGLVPSAAKQYADVVARVASESGWQVSVLYGIGWRETKWGTSRLLDEQGPTGAGDYMARAGHWLSATGVLLINSLDDLAGLSYASKWKVPSGINGPYAIPNDGRGWGRGLMQIDYGNALSTDWTDPYANISRAAEMLTQKKNYIANRVPNLAPGDLLAATIAAYNHGEGAVAQNLENGRSIDFGTDGNNYSSDVLASAAKWGLSLGEVV